MRSLGLEPPPPPRMCIAKHLGNKETRGFAAAITVLWFCLWPSFRRSTSSRCNNCTVEQQENISTSSRGRRKVCDLHRKRCELALCFGEMIAHLINTCFVPFDIFFCFYISSSQILRAALKPTSPPILPAEQIHAESPPREHVVLSNEDPEIPS